MLLSGRRASSARREEHADGCIEPFCQAVPEVQVESCNKIPRSPSSRAATKRGIIGSPPD